MAGVDQLEVVSDGDGVYHTPEGSLDGEEDLDVGSMVEVVIKEVPRSVPHTLNTCHAAISGVVFSLW